MYNMVLQVPLEISVLTPGEAVPALIEIAKKVNMVLLSWSAIETLSEISVGLRSKRRLTCFDLRHSVESEGIFDQFGASRALRNYGPDLITDAVPDMVNMLRRGCRKANITWAGRLEKHLGKAGPQAVPELIKVLEDIADQRISVTSASSYMPLAISARRQKAPCLSLSKR